MEKTIAKTSFCLLVGLLCMTVLAEAAYIKAFDIDEITGMYLDSDSLRCEMGKRREAPFYGIEGAYFFGKFYVMDKRTGEKIKESFIPMSAMYSNQYQGFSVMVEKNVFYKSAVMNVLEGLIGQRKRGSEEREDIRSFYNCMTGGNDDAYLLIAECMWYTYTGKPSPFQGFVSRDGKQLISPIRYGDFRHKEF